MDHHVMSTMMGLRTAVPEDEDSQVHLVFVWMDHHVTLTMMGLRTMGLRTVVPEDKGSQAHLLISKMGLSLDNLYEVKISAENEEWDSSTRPRIL